MSGVPSQEQVFGYGTKRNRTWAMRRADPALPCPECRIDGHIGSARIGNRKATCLTCNRFSSAVRRGLWATIRDLWPEIFREALLRTEIDVYKRTVQPRFRDRADR